MTSACETGALALIALLGAGLPAGAASADADQAAARVEQVILDIVSFTRWPQPMPQLRLCVVGPSAYAGRFFDTTGPTGGVPVHAKQITLDGSQIGAACDIIYEGALTGQERESLGRGIAGHPVLTVGEAVSGCTQTTMFCLELDRAGGGRIPFSSNLDAIARSGVRLNPRVLLLGRSFRATP